MRIPKTYWALGALMFISTFTFGQAQKGDFVAGAMTRSAGGGGRGGLWMVADLTLQGGYMLTDRLEVGANLGGSVATWRFQQHLGHTWGASLYARYYITKGRWQPYVFTGLSLDHRTVLSRDFEGVETERFFGTDVGADLGLGLQFWATENVSIFTEAKYRHTVSTLNGTYSRPGGDFIMPSLGVRWNLSGHRRMKAALD